jgi:hypothetical protein
VKKDERIQQLEAVVKVADELAEVGDGMADAAIYSRDPSPKVDDWDAALAAYYEAREKLDGLQEN